MIVLVIGPAFETFRLGAEKIMQAGPVFSGGKLGQIAGAHMPHSGQGRGAAFVQC